MTNSTARQQSTPSTSVAGMVTGIYIATCAGAPMQSQASADLIAGRGIAGDRYALGLGFWSNPVWPDQDLTLIESEIVAALNLRPGEARRNLETTGVRLGDLIGATFRIGTAELVGVRSCDPCAHLDELTRHGVAGALRHRGGLRAGIVRGGHVSTGDPIVVSVTTSHEERMSI